MGTFDDESEAELFCETVGGANDNSGRPQDKKGEDYLYLIQPHDESVCGLPVIKIGRTVHPDNRLKSIQACSPVPLIIRHLYRMNDATHMETECHRQFKDKRIHGEWFTVSSGEVDDFISTLSIPHTKVVCEPKLTLRKRESALIARIVERYRANGCRLPIRA